VLSGYHVRPLCVLFLRSAKCYGPDYDQDIEEDKRYCFLVSVRSSCVREYSRTNVRTSHERPHRIDQIDHFRLYACIVLHAASERGLRLLRIAPADCTSSRVSAGLVSYGLE
jgi:hypothetical protein